MNDEAPNRPTLELWGNADWDDAWVSRAGVLSALHLAGLDLSDRPQLGAGADFSTLTWRACQGQHFADDRYQGWAKILDVADARHRKAWEWAAILETARLGGVLVEGKSAVGFGVGTEPLSAALARFGMLVTATDLPMNDDESDHWASAAQHAASKDNLRHPAICRDAEFDQRVEFVAADMNALPAEIENRKFDFAWSSCVIEHLGSPAKGFDFVRHCFDLLKPGGIMIHTTEYELTAQHETQDYGHCAVYRQEDFSELADYFRAQGCSIDVDLGVSLAMPEDRWISSQAVPGAYDDGYAEPAHLRLVIGDSVATSFAIVVQRPAD